MGTLTDYVVGVNNQLAADSSMRVGEYCKHPDGRTVYVQSGAFLRGGRVSNFWYWYELLDDGTLGAEEHGYGW